MSETLIFLLGEKTSQPVRWGAVGPDGLRESNVIQDFDALETVRPYLKKAEIILCVLPGEQVAMRALPSPPRSPSKFKAAAMYLLEDDLAESLDKLHIAVTRRDGTGVAFAVKKSVMSEWQDVFAAVGIQPDIVAADFSLLSDQKEHNTIIFEKERIICSIEDSGFAAARPMADNLVATLVSNETVDGMAAYGNAQTEQHEIHGKPVRWQGASDEATLFGLYANSAAKNITPNFLQGAYKKQWDWRASIAPWRRAAILAAACLIGLIGVTIAEGNRSARLAERLNQQALEVHRTAFPESANVDSRRHARQILSAQRVGPGFLSLTSAFADAIDGDDQIQIDRIRYNAARGEYSVNLSFSDINALESLKSQLLGRGISVSEAGGVRRSGNRYIGELQVNAS